MRLARILLSTALICGGLLISLGCGATVRPPELADSRRIVVVARRA